MTLIQPALILALIACLLSCVNEKASAAEQPLSGRQVNGWPGKKYDRVIGYLFDNPTPEPFSLLRAAPVDMALLAKLKTKEAPLTEAQADRLLKAVFDSKLRFGLTACYNPHHIFVFFSGDKPVAAIEVCFSCGNIAFSPNKDTDFHFDLEALAKLSVELGLGLGPTKRTLDEYVRHVHDRLKDD